IIAAGPGPCVASGDGGPSCLMRGLTRLLAGLLAVASVMAVAVGPTAVAGAQGDEAIHFDAVDITIRRDGSLLVHEVIDYDFGTTPHHGIFRDIPYRLTYDGRYDRVFPTDALSAHAAALL